MEARRLQRQLVLGNVPARWPAAVVPLPVGVVSAGMGLLWWLRGAETAASVWAALGLLGFAAADGLVLLSLPRLRISFGPLAPQWYLLTAARAGLGCLCALAIPWLDATATLMGFSALNWLAWLALVWGAIREPARIDVSEVTLYGHNSIPTNPLVRLLHISDIHVERLGRREALLLSLVRELHPDLIVLTGDYVNLSYVDDPISHAHARQLLEALCAEAAALTPSPALYAVLGSPPVDRNAAPLFDGLPIRLLRNEVVHVAPRPGCAFALIGLDCTHDLERDAAQLERLATTIAPGTLRILLYHSPELMPRASRLGIDLYLCGHTHGGQIRLPLYGALVTSSRLGKRYERGLYREGTTHLYVSRGVGLEGLCAPRIRFLCSPEIILWRLYCPTQRTATPSTPDGHHCQTSC
ncbi:MAG: metallophosphoesterase [Anaerolineae bacterium]|nr:metallophosphoesterase [Anaerolineae bacterium]